MIHYTHAKCMPPQCVTCTAEFNDATKHWFKDEGVTAKEGAKIVRQRMETIGAQSKWKFAPFQKNQPIAHHLLDIKEQRLSQQEAL